MCDLRSIILISGAMGAGKTSVGNRLISSHQFAAIRTGLYLEKILGDIPLDRKRRALQELGDRLDTETDFRWVADVARSQIDENFTQMRWLLDSVRKPRQVEHFRYFFGQDVIHIHLFASENVLSDRYTNRWNTGGSYQGSMSYNEAIAHPNEVQARSLIHIADLSFDTAVSDAEQIADTVMERIHT